MSGENVRAVLFDLGGVLVDVDLDRSRRRWASLSGLSMDLFDDAFFESGLKARMDLDPLDVEDVELLVNRRIEGGRREGSMVIDEAIAIATRLRGDEIVAIWNACILPRPELAATVADLGERVQVGVLSDTDPFHARYVQSFEGLREAVNHWTFSYEVGRLKPDPLTYRTALDRLGASPTEVLFVDDKPGNVAAARALGLDAARCTSSAEVTAALASRGLA